ncbi:MAG TPA: hypothetical protein VKV29_00120 [Chthonomonas sp.]|nr:hypothetical protein [Chthonomonas sp.]HLH78668.1 hypothetical protein [Chthonomonas sp.]
MLVPAYDGEVGVELRQAHASEAIKDAAELAIEEVRVWIQRDFRSGGH